MENLLKLQEEDRGFIARFWTNVLKLGKSKLTRGTLQSRLELLEGYWKDFRQRHKQLLVAKDIHDHEYMQNEVYDEVENSYLDAKSCILEHLDGLAEAAKEKAKAQLNQPEVNQAHTATKAIQAKLPKLSLPEFSGDIMQWETFRDMFKSLVHNATEISNVAKLQYLRAHNRYDNKRILVFGHLRYLLAIPTVNKATSAELKRVLDGICETRRSLESLDRPVAQWDDWFVLLMLQRIDYRSRQDWETSIGDSKEIPAFEELKKFLENRVRGLEAANAGADASSKPLTGAKEGHKHRRNGTSSNHGATSNKKESCPECEEAHFIAYCPSFRKRTPDQRREKATIAILCINCLSKNHPTKECKSEKRCLTCQGKHHTMMHGSKAPVESSPTNEHAATASHSQIQANLAGANRLVSLNTLEEQSSSKTNPVLLATAIVTLVSPSGRRVKARALLDQGSEASFITESIAQQLRLPRSIVNVPITGIGSSNAGIARHKVQLRLHSIVEPNFQVDLEALVLPRLSSALPAQRIRADGWSHLKDIALADPDYRESRRVDVVLGAGIYALILRDGLRRGPAGTPMAQHTTLGWVLSGQTTGENTLLEPQQSYLTGTSGYHCAARLDLGDMLQKFWKLEKVPSKPVLTDNEKQCEQHYAETHARVPEGDVKRYMVRLPMCDQDTTALRETKAIAKKILTRTERKFLENPSFGEHYARFMTEYAELGHMVPVPEGGEDPERSCYLPHHAVIRDVSTSTKMRVVFNGSQATSSGQSLNDCLLVGPSLLNDLTSVIMRWRRHAIVLTADIVKMFRQILVHPTDRDLQRIVWRNSPEEDIQAYQLTTVTYGTACAPFLANRTLRQLAMDERDRWPLGASILEEDTYVDDILTGADDLDGAKIQQEQLTRILHAGGFDLAKWGSNSEHMINYATDSQQKRSLQPDECIRTLGLIWDPVKDCFQFKINQPIETGIPTKRKVLAETARLFDPLGWLAPIIIRPKILLQNLWLCGADWDDSIPDDLQTTWSIFRKELPDIEAIDVPRWMGTHSTGWTWQLHGFSDASQRAYAAVVYVRATHQESGEVRITLLTARTKVAPVKTVSIPRLELCGANLLAHTLVYVLEAMRFENVLVYAWSDSKVTLAWLRSHPSRWKPFVANRVADIHTILPQASWNHVPTTSNPADCASRGCSPDELRQSELWWHGPTWLSREATDWPAETTLTETDADREKRPLQGHHAMLAEAWELLERYATLSKLLRVTAYCFRFVRNTRKPKLSRTITSLTTQELDDSRLFWVKQVQQLEFQPEITALRAGKTLTKTSRLLSLQPFLDPHGVLRVGGRLRKAPLSYEEKHPAILPNQSHFTHLLILQAHLDTLHGGPQLTSSHLLRKYWILHWRNSIRKTIKSCVRCTRFRAQNATQAMGDLPAPRLTRNRPFLHTGVDYAGPVLLKASKGRGQATLKGYIAVFICMATKAAHLELVSSYASSEFIACFRRFVSRRGKCAALYSDNGTTFQGANHELRLLHQQALDQWQQTAETLANEGTQWHFIPPQAPHFGGLWEAGVKSVKHHLHRILGTIVPTYEEYTTLLAQIEACLNSRPISPLSSNPLDLSALTPGHFLIGEPLTNVPEPSTIGINVNRMSRWQLISNATELFWQRWHREYLHELQTRSKWTRVEPNLQANQLVFIKEDNLPPAKWSLGRVLETHPGLDGLTRVVTLRTKKGVIKRPIAKVCPLPVEPNDASTAGGLPTM